MKTVKIINMDEGRSIYESFIAGDNSSMYGVVKSIVNISPDPYGAHTGYYELTIEEDKEMKTIFDAVNEFKGVWKFKNKYICATNSKNASYKEDTIKLSDVDDVNHCHYHIGTKEEFNELVAEMMLGLDVNRVSHQSYIDYLSSNKEPLEPIKQNLIYTQEMYDNGVLPSVGMEFLHKGLVAVTLSISKEHEGVVTFTCDDGVSIECCWFNDAWVKPITPSTPLIDGEAYQFDYHKGTFKGYFKLSTGRLYHSKGYYHESVCTNIKPLTLKGE